jgi:hypothetical protein
MDMRSPQASRVGQIRDELSQIMDDLRRAGFLGQTASGVGAAREAAPDPLEALRDGMAPMISSVPQADR